MNRPTISLLTDFGLRDPFVGVMKGVIATRCPNARVIDLTHAIRPQAVAEGAFWLARSYPWLPPGSIHVAVVDPGVGTARRALVVEESGHRFVAPDNGLLDGVLTARSRCFTVDVAALGLPVPSRTFHGRDVFAPVAAEIASGRLTPDAVGPETAVRRASGEPPRTSDGVVVGRVAVIDHFGNIISDIDAQSLGFSSAVIEMGEARAPLCSTYADVAVGAFVALINSFGTVELALRDGSAAAALGAAPGAPFVVRRG